ncbi:hypothetical protein LXL04_034837 [Taraxacum kok-saghyz]
MMFMQIKEANKLVNNTRKKKKFKGVPVFTAQNLDIAIATTDGIMWGATSFQKASMLPDTGVPDSDSDSDVDNKQLCKSGFHSPFGDWFMNPWLNPLHDPSDKR